MSTTDKAGEPDAPASPHHRPSRCLRPRGVVDLRGRADPPAVLAYPADAVVVVSGLPGSGKSTVMERWSKAAPAIDPRAAHLACEAVMPAWLPYGVYRPWARLRHFRWLCRQMRRTSPVLVQGLAAPVAGPVCRTAGPRAACGAPGRGGGRGARGAGGPGPVGLATRLRPAPAGTRPPAARVTRARRGTPGRRRGPRAPTAGRNGLDSAARPDIARTRGGGDVRPFALAVLPYCPIALCGRGRGPGPPGGRHGPRARPDTAAPRTMTVVTPPPVREPPPASPD